MNIKYQSLYSALPFTVCFHIFGLDFHVSLEMDTDA